MIFNKVPFTVISVERFSKQIKSIASEWRTVRRKKRKEENRGKDKEKKKKHNMKRKRGLNKTGNWINEVASSLNFRFLFFPFSQSSNLLPALIRFFLVEESSIHNLSQSVHVRSSSRSYQRKQRAGYHLKHAPPLHLMKTPRWLNSSEEMIVEFLESPWVQRLNALERLSV